MDIEDFLYLEALAKTRLDRYDGSVWESRDSIREYQMSMDNFIKRLYERDGDWIKLFGITDIRNFVHQVYQDYVPPKVNDFIHLFSYIRFINSRNVLI